MNKKTLRVLLSAFAIVLVGGISFGIVMKLKASDSVTYKNRIIAKKSFELNGEKLSYVSPEEADSLYSDKIAYKNNDGEYYYFDADTQRLCLIDNAGLDRKSYEGLTASNVKPYYDGAALLENAKERISKWVDSDDTEAQVEWRTETDETGTTRIRMCQVINGEFSVILASAVYDMDGDFRFARLNYDSVLDSNNFTGYVSEEEAIAKAKDFLLQEYGENDWEEIIADEVTAGEEGIYWVIECLKTYGGYAVRVDVLTGETVFYSMMK